MSDYAMSKMNENQSNNTPKSLYDAEGFKVPNSSIDVSSINDPARNIKHNIAMDSALGSKKRSSFAAIGSDNMQASND
jgi:hypothetical protein